jgi:serine/threonine protein kinase
MGPTPGLVASRYRLRELLGVGGMGRVWLATDEVLGRDVAVKQVVLPAEMLDELRDVAKERTLREARAAARLSHPNVVRVYDVLEADGQPWIVMEYVAAKSLQEVGPLDPREVARIGLELVSALRAAHRTGVHHRDIKPANVLLADDGRVVLTDFGIAVIEGDGYVTRSGLVLGSPEFIAPERARDGTAGAPGDLWSLGATLYAAVEGRAPFKRGSAIETLSALATQEPDPPVRAGPLEPALRALLRKDPNKRADLQEAEELLRAAVDGARPERPRPQRHKRALAVLVAALVLASVVVGLALMPQSERPQNSAPGPITTSAARANVPDQAPPSTPSSPSQPAGSPAGSPRPTAGPALPPLPAGWQHYTDPTGFSVYVPAGWSRSKEGSIMYFRDPGSGRILGIDQTDRPEPDPVADWRQKAAYRVQRGDFPGYREIHIVAVPYFLKAADWEFTFDRRGRQHVNNRGVVVSPSKAYGFYWQTRDADWAAARPDLQLIFDSFRPASAGS